LFPKPQLKKCIQKEVSNLMISSAPMVREKSTLMIVRMVLKQINYKVEFDRKVEKIIRITYKLIFSTSFGLT